MRTYLPTTLSALERSWQAGTVSPPPEIGFTVTPALREWYEEGDEEELEYLALLAAARASLSLLAADPAASLRRVVLAVDLPDRPMPPVAGQDRAAVMLAEPVVWEAVVAVHADDAAAADTLRRAISALPAATAGDSDAAFLVEAAEGEELLWYATQEVPGLLAAAGGPGV